jgi:predicted transcriptional regulator
MKTLTLKLPDDLNTRLNMVSKKKGISKSHVVRKALAVFFVREEKPMEGSFLSLAEDLSGCIDAPPDLSTEKKYMEEYGQ